jgi:4-hydroxy-3-methylbut-2-enyl diphosphate reductase
MNSFLNGVLPKKWELYKTSQFLIRVDMKIYLAKYRGFCSGVKRSIRLAQKAREEISGPINILNEIVHNSSVIEKLESQGLGRIHELEDADEGTLIISAHGVPPEVITKAQAKGLNVIDTTCPLVKLIHRTAKSLISDGYEVVLFGDSGHDEVKGIQGVDPDNIHLLVSANDINRLPDFDGPVAFISQSTQSYDDFLNAADMMKKRFNNCLVKNTICKATIRRQEAVKQLASFVGLVVVIGSSNSANSRRLFKIAENMGIKSYLFDKVQEFDPKWLEGIENIGITAGASTPEALVDEVLKKIMEQAEERGISTELVEV